MLRFRRMIRHPLLGYPSSIPPRSSRSCFRRSSTRLPAFRRSSTYLSAFHRSSFRRSLIQLSLILLVHRPLVLRLKRI